MSSRPRRRRTASSRASPPRPGSPPGTFERLPFIIALEADAATMMQLVRMPEVVSIRADREIPVPMPPGDVPVPNVPSGGKAR